MEKLIYSMMRFSTAVTLFGMEQMQNAMNTMGGQEDFDEAVGKFRGALDSFTDAMVEGMDKSKRDALDSFDKVSKDTVKRTFEGVDVGSMMDPREMMRTTSDLIKKTSDSVADFMEGEGNESESEDGESPQPAAEALSKKSKSKK